MINYGYKFQDKLMLVLLLVGGITLGLQAVFSGFDLISWIAEQTIDAIDMILKIAIGLSAVIISFSIKRKKS